MAKAEGILALPRGAAPKITAETRLPRAALLSTHADSSPSSHFSDAGRRGRGAAGDHLAHRGPPPGTPGPGRSPWCSPNPLMSSVKTPGSLSMRHHSPALLAMAPTTRRPTSTARSLRSPQAPGCHRPRTSAKPAAERQPHVTPPTSRQPPGAVTCRATDARRDALATRETSKLLLRRLGLSASVERSPPGGRRGGASERRREAHPGPLALRSRGGAMGGAGLEKGRGPFWPPPPPAGAGQGFFFRRRGS